MSGSDNAAMRRHHDSHRPYYPPPRPPHRQQNQWNGENLSDWGSSGEYGMTAFPIPPPPMWYPVAPSPPPPPPPSVTNLDRFIKAVTPSVNAQLSNEANGKNWRGKETEMRPFYGLDNLWESFAEWSAYGVGVPLVLKGEELVVQYYVPYLSGLQLYVDPVQIPSRCRKTGENKVVSCRETCGCGGDYEAGNYGGDLVFEYMGQGSPYLRKTLADQVSALALEYPDLMKYKSCELHPSSWISVAWYPIYRIPVGPTLKDLSASFLTFHSLSPTSKDDDQPWSHGVDDVAKIQLPVFGLAHYRLQGSILSPSGPHECEQETSLLRAADSWLRNLQAIHPDYEYFTKNYSQWR